MSRAGLVGGLVLAVALVVGIGPAAAQGPAEAGALELRMPARALEAVGQSGPGALPANVQIPPAAVRLGWDYHGDPLGITFELEAAPGDGAPVVSVLAAVDVGAMPDGAGRLFEAPLAPLAPGSYALKVCARNVAGRACSEALAVDVVAMPRPPGRLRLTWEGVAQ